MVVYTIQVNNTTNIATKITQLNDRVPLNLLIDVALNNITFNSATDEIMFDFAQNLSDAQVAILNILIRINVEEIPVEEIFTSQRIVTTTKTPSSLNDNLNGYVPGSICVNTNTYTVFFCYDNTTANAVWNDISMQSSQPHVANQTRGLPLNYRFNDGFETASTTYTVAGYLVYRGTLVDGNIPLILALMYLRNVGTTYQVRVFDTTNNKTIAESGVTTGGSEGTPSIVNLGTIGNLPTNQAVFEIQIRRGSGGNRVGIHSIQMYA